jgi:hypothetical protein
MLCGAIRGFGLRTQAFAGKKWGTDISEVGSFYKEICHFLSQIEVPAAES